MKIDNNKDTVENEILWIKQLFSLHVTFSSLSDVPVVLNILNSDANANFKNRRFSHEPFLLFKHLSTWHAFLHSQPHILEFHIQSFLQEPQSSNSLHSHWHSPQFHFCSELHEIPFNLHWHSYYSRWTRNFAH